MMIGLLLVKSFWLLIAIASASQVEGEGFDSRERHPKFATTAWTVSPQND